MTKQPISNEQLTNLFNKLLREQGEKHKKIETKTTHYFIFNTGQIEYGTEHIYILNKADQEHGADNYIIDNAIQSYSRDAQGEIYKGFFFVSLIIGDGMGKTENDQIREEIRQSDLHHQIKNAK